MWKTWFSFIFLQAFFLTAQTVSLEDIDFAPTDTLQGSYAIKAGNPYVFIASAFGAEEITKTASLDSISGFLIREIVLVYSRYHKAENFNQARLNEARWNNLLKTYPTLFQHGIARFRNVCQDVTGDTTAKKL